MLWLFLQIKIDPSAFKDIKDDVAFAYKLLEEESVVVLPGQVRLGLVEWLWRWANCSRKSLCEQCFGITNYMRIMIAPPQPILEEAFTRMDAFCKRHVKP